VRISDYQFLIKSAAFSRDNRLVAFARFDKNVHVFDVRAQRELYRLKGGTWLFLAVSISTDGKTLLATDRQEVIAWELGSGSEIWRVRVRETYKFESAALSADGQRAVFGDTTGAVVWDLQSKRPILTAPIRRLIQSVAISADGRFAAYCDSQDVVVLETTSGRTAARLSGHEIAPTHIAISADGRRVLSASNWNRTLLLWGLRPKP
jgi:WD40 repeat protein